MKRNNVFELIKLSLWGKGNPTVDLAVFQEMKKQAIVALPGQMLPFLGLTPELMKEWRSIIFQQVTYFTYYEYVQSHLPIDMPYVILKGTSAAQYYPWPEYRTMGDIDIITRREDYGSVCEAMMKNAWRETTSEMDQKRGRHRTFEKKGVVVEIHAFFASMNDVDKAKAFDDLVISNITDNHVLPDLINGLVLIDHVNQHMEEGIGLRQIIDWMMFVDRCLTDEKWDEFEKMVSQTGLKELAVTTTRMCEIYLGLQAHKWSIGAREKLCGELMEYVMKCGNFGADIDQTDSLYITGLYQLRHPIKTFKDLQKKGCENPTITKNPILKPFAWILEAGRNVRKTPNLLQKFHKARKTNSLFRSLGVCRSTDGLVFYENGRYFKQK